MKRLSTTYSITKHHWRFTGWLPCQTLTRQVLVGLSRSRQRSVRAFERWLGARAFKGQNLHRMRRVRNFQAGRRARPRLLGHAAWAAMHYKSGQRTNWYQNLDGRGLGLPPLARVAQVALLRENRHTFRDSTADTIHKATERVLF